MAGSDMFDKYEMTIGIECHVQLATDTKLFSGADNDARGKQPNSVVSPIDYGLPGMLPILNRKAVDLAIKAGKALNAEIAHLSRFDRKHYFYPDLPKGYQTTQMYQPIILEGFVNAPLEDGSEVKVRIHHAHMEEDAGKLTHYGDHSLVDLNRASELGKRAEVKNLNSFRSVEKAAEYEFKRQVELLEKGEQVVQETRGWDDDKMITTSQRSKEDAQDYRYMPDPDIPPIVLTSEEIAEIQATVPMLPPVYRDKWAALGLDRSVTDSLLGVQAHAKLIADVQDKAGDDAAKRVAHWFVSALGHNEEDETTGEPKLFSPDGFIELAQMVEKNELSSTAAKEVFNQLLTSDKSPREIAESKNLLQVSDESAIAAIVEEVLADPASAASIADIKAGKDKAIGYLVGQIMKKSQGKANPALAQKLIRERL